MTIEGPKNVNNKSTARSPPTSCHNNRSHFTDKQTQIHNHKRSQPVLTQPGYNRIKKKQKHMTSPQKSISQAHLCACVCVDVPKNRRKISRLYLVEFNSTKATQSHADTIPPPYSLYLSKTCHRWPRMHFFTLKNRSPWPLTYSICATPRPLTPHANSVVASQFVMHKVSKWPSHFTYTKTCMTQAGSTPSAVPLSSLFLKGWLTYTQSIPFFSIFSFP